MWEAGKLKMLVQGLNVPIVDSDTKNSRIEVLINYFLDKKNNNDWYAFRFFFCEILNFINVIGQIFFIDFFLGGEFSTYGSDVISMSESPEDQRYDPMSHVFPKVNSKISRFIFNLTYSSRWQNAHSTNMVLVEAWRPRMVFVFSLLTLSMRRFMCSFGSGLCSSLLSQQFT